MQSINGRLVYSATDLVGFVECGHLGNLERAAAQGHLVRPVREDPVLDRVAERGLQHEQRFLATLREDALDIVEIDVDRVTREEGARQTVEAMRAGADVIYQAVMLDERRIGLVDFLRRIESPSDLGAWSYEVWDTKLARHAKASAVLQLCMYSDMAGVIQGAPPREMHLALGGVARETVSFRVADYAAYYRSVAGDFEALLATESFPVASRPDPVDHCEVCRWSERCRGELRAADDLSLVAGITSRQRRALRDIDVHTRGDLAGLALPPAQKLQGASAQSLARIQAQARLQVEGDAVRPALLHERIPPPRTREGDRPGNYGLSMLPEPSPGDLFFDIEGDPFFGTEEIDGIDYLFGLLEPGVTDADGQPTFHRFWAIEDGEVSTAAERRAFEAFIDLVMERLARDPNLHVYHYAPYEPTALKRLAGRYATREDELDRLLRGRVLVDLYRAVRQGIRASVESYSIKKLEPLYAFHRSVDLHDAGTSIVEFETWLELGTDERADALLAEIEGYNRDDCVSTHRLRDWLEEQRTLLARDLGEDIPRPALVPTEEREASERQQEVQALVERLTEGLPAELPGDADRGRWLLAQLLDWHRREQKSYWWRYFHLKNELTDEERREAADALGELTYEGVVDEIKQSVVYRFRFPPQEHRFDVGQEPHDPGTPDQPMGSPVGTIERIDESGFIDLKRGRRQPVPAPTSLIPGRPIGADPKPEALRRIALWVLAYGIDGDGPFRAARDLLMRRHPRLGGASGEPLLAPGEDTQAAARRLVQRLEASTLAIQGPPGSGKTTVGAQMIVDLVEAGQRVAVSATSHKVIGNLLEETAAEAARRGVEVRIGQKPSGDDPCTYAGAVRLQSNDDVLDALAERSVDVIGGTAWLWSREDVQEQIDVLFIDEAGQMSLADALAASTCARNLVLLGDPQQLDQPLQGVHPPGADRSALAHLLGQARTMPPEYGLFLDGTWRLHPAITGYTSEMFYDDRLHSHPGRERQDLDGAPPMHGTGLRLIPVPHAGNSSDAIEEAEAIARHVRALFAAGPTWTNAAGEAAPLTPADVLVITPYNAQVRALQDALPGFRVGTVDKFQGQQAPISIYSMATSTPEDAPRGMEFLYSLNRLNVATSRARCLAVVVASPQLFRVRCRTPRQMQLANALARLMEVGEAPVER